MADERSKTTRKPIEKVVPPEREISSEPQTGEVKIDHALRPRSLSEMIGQERLRDKMQILVDAAKKRGDTLDHVLLYGPPGLGKCITVNSLILTSAGWKPFSEILPEKFANNTYQPQITCVYGIHGVEPTSHVYANGLSPTRRIKTRSGFEIEGTENHPLLVATENGPQWKPLSMIKKGDSVAIARSTNQWGQAESIDQSSILLGTRQATVEFLGKLFDMDGCACLDGIIEFRTHSEALAQQVQLLLVNLGVIAHRTEKQQTEATLWHLFIDEQEVIRFRGLVEVRFEQKHEAEVYWDSVVSTHESSAETFDFVVPGTHSFVANGFYNHNTTLSHILAQEIGANLKVTAGPAIEKAGDLAAILTNLRRGDVLFIDEIHRLGRAVEEILYPAMEDFALDIVVGSGPSARNIRLSLPKFTVVGATTRLALMTSPLRARFGVVERFDFYSIEALQEIVTRAANLLAVTIGVEGAHEIAQRARGTPRVALRLLRRVRDYAEVRAQGIIDKPVADLALSLLEIDWLGLDDLDRRVLDAIINKFNGGPVGLDTLAASISEEGDTIMDVVEPYLLQLGFLDRSPRGRIATKAAYGHLNVPYPDRNEQGSLF